MKWSIVFTDQADEDFARLDKAIQRRIFRYLHERVANSEDPRDFGKRLQHQLSNLWSYRVGDYRILCALEENQLTVLVVEIGHRSKIYEQ